MIQSNTTVKWLEKIIVKAWMAAVSFVPETKSAAAGMPPAEVLLTKTCCFGDAVLTLYAIREYKRRQPQVAIDILCSNRIAPVYRSLEAVRNVFTVPVTGRGLGREIARFPFFRVCLQLYKELKKHQYDMLIDLELYHGYPVVLKTLLKIPRSRGFKVESTYPKNHNIAIIRERQVPEWQCFYMLFGLEDALQEKPAPLYPLPGPKRGTGRATLGVVFGSSFNWPQKQWPLCNFIAIMNSLSSQGFKFVLFGVDHEKDQAARIETEVAGDIQNLVGRLDFKGLLSAISTCDLLFGNDTGTMHLAAACGIPAVTLFGPTEHRKWNALTSAPISLALNCSPCYYLSAMPECPHINCLKGLSPKKALEVIEKKIKEIS